VARELDLEPSVVAPRGLLEALVTCRQEGREAETIAELRHWQLDLLRPLLG
jgi:hypothetical protein